MLPGSEPTVDGAAGRVEILDEPHGALSAFEVPEVGRFAFELRVRPGHPDPDVMVVVVGMNVGQHGPGRRPHRMDERTAVVQRALPGRRRHDRMMVAQHLLSADRDLQVLRALDGLDESIALRCARDQLVHALLPGRQCPAEDPVQPRRHPRLDLGRHRGTTRTAHLMQRERLVRHRLRHRR